MIDERNQKRLLAAQAIYDLWRDGEETQLELLEVQVRRAVEDLKAKKNEV